jgi:small-conductance mechanosensitive channel
MLRAASHTPWEGDEVAIRAIRGPVVLWSLMAGVYLAMEFSPVPEATVDAAGRFLKAAWLFSVAWVSANTIGQLITFYASKRQMALPMTSLTRHLARLAILALGMLLILDSLGVRIGSLLAALGIGSLAVALGLQDTLANLFAGLYVTLSKNIRVGDYIRLESGEEGHVTDIGWRATKIRMLPNNVVIVPNAKFSQSIITNYDLPEKELAVLVELGVDYASDLERVEQVTCDVARDVMRTVPGGVPGVEPLVRYHTFGDSGIRFTVVMRARAFVDQYLIKHEFIKRLHNRYAQEGIAIPFPTRTIRMRQTV